MTKLAKNISGSLVAIVTPMHADGSLDLPGLRQLIDWHIEQGTDGIVIVGTTGESPTVSVEEHCELIKVTVEHTAKRIPIRRKRMSNARRRRELVPDQMRIER